MSGLTKMNLKMPEYLAGSCNIGSAEIRRRQISGSVGAVLSLSFWVTTFVFHASKGIRALLFFPLLLTAIGWIQSRRRFCLAYGLRGVFNFGNLGEASRVQDPMLRAADRSLALRMFAQASLVAAAFALVFTFIPA